MVALFSFLLDEACFPFCLLKPRKNKKKGLFTTKHKYSSARQQLDKHINIFSEVCNAIEFPFILCLKKNPVRNFQFLITI